MLKNVNVSGKPLSHGYFSSEVLDSLVLNCYDASKISPRIAADKSGRLLIKFEGGKCYVEGHQYKNTGMLRAIKGHQRHSRRNI